MILRRGDLLRREECDTEERRVILRRGECDTEERRV